MVWLEVRILPAPPRSLALAEISWRLPNSRELAGSAVPVPVSAETNDGCRSVLTELSLALESRFPETVRLEGFACGRGSISLVPGLMGGVRL
jgi:hypothetical protein